FSFTTTFPLNGTADFMHLVRFQATDRAGNMSGLVGVSFLLDTQAPTVTIASPAPGLLTNQDPIVTGRVTDNLNGVVALKAQVDSSSFFDVSFDPLGNYSFPTTLPLN